MHRALKRHLAIVLASLVAFAGGVLVYDATHPPVAEASSVSGGGSGGTCGTGSGSLVCAAAPTLTGAVAITGPGTLTINGTTTATNALSLLCNKSGGQSGSCINATGNTSSPVINVVNSATPGIRVVTSTNASSTAIEATAAATGGIAINANGNAAAISATSTTGYALIITGDTTSPARGHASFAVQDANPTACLVGDLSVQTGGRAKMCSAVTPTWRSLAFTDSETFTGTTTFTPGSAVNAIAITANGAAEGLYSYSANNSSSNACQCDGNSAGNGVYASSSGAGTALTVVNGGGGVPVSITGDATSPAVGHIRFTVGDTNPTSCQVGDLFMFTGGVLRVCTATTPTWVNVGSQ